MTQFGFHSDSKSPARLRMEAAGRQYEEQQASAAAYRHLSEKQRRKLTARWALEMDAAAKARRAADYLYGQPAIRILMEVAAKHGLHQRDIRGDALARDVTAARHECYWRMRNELGWSHPRVGQYFGKDRTTVMHGCRKHELRMGEASNG